MKVDDESPLETLRGIRRVSLFPQASPPPIQEGLKQNSSLSARGGRWPRQMRNADGFRSGGSPIVRLIRRSRMSAGRKAPPALRSFPQKALSGAPRTAVFLKKAAGRIGIRPAMANLHACALAVRPAQRLYDSLYPGRVTGGAPACNFLVRHGRHIDMRVDAVKRPGSRAR